jgi:hypothetical protein
MGKFIIYSSCSSFVLILSLFQITSGVVHILNHQLQPSSHASSPTFFARDPTVASAQKSRQLAGRDPYAAYFPADITEPFVKKNRCPYPAKQSREIPGVAMFDDMFSQILRFYDGGKQLHHKSKFMGIRMGQFPFDLQVMTEVINSSHTPPSSSHSILLSISRSCMMSNLILSLKLEPMLVASPSTSPPY